MRNSGANDIATAPISLSAKLRRKNAAGRLAAVKTPLPTKTAAMTLALVAPRELYRSLSLMARVLSRAIPL